MNKISLNKTTLMAAALTCSLAGNLYAVTYNMGHHTRQHVAISNLARKQLDSMLGPLPHERQAAIRKEMSGDVEKLKVQLKEAKQDREQLAQLLTAPTLDKDAINTQFAQMRNDTISSQEHLQNMMLQAFEQMSPEERQKAVERIGTPEKK